MTADIEAFFSTWDRPSIVNDALDFFSTFDSAEVTVKNYSLHKAELQNTLESWLQVGNLQAPRARIVNRSLSYSELKLQRELNRLLGKEASVLSTELCDRLSDIPSDDLRPSLNVQEKLWDRLAEPVSRFNERVEADERYNRQRDIYEGEKFPEDSFVFSGNQMRVLASRIAKGIDPDFTPTQGALQSAARRIRIAYIHIGLHKTGSTFLQHTMALNRQQLLERGICYPEVIGNDLYGFQHVALALDAKNGDFDRLKETVNASFERAPKVLLSSEEFYPIANKNYINRLRMMFDAIRHSCDEINVIVYVRRQDNCVQSVYRTAVKSSEERVAQTFQEFVKARPFFPDYWRNLQSWKEMSDQLIIRPYERGQFYEKALLPDFLSILGAEDLHQVARESHRSLSAAVTELIRRGNSTRRPEDMWPLIERLEKAIPEELLYDGGGGSPYMSPEERREYNSRYAPGNERIAREWLGREDGILFYEPVPDEDQRADLSDATIEKLERLLRQCGGISVGA